MPATKNQILRIEILDEMLQHRHWTADALLNNLNSRIEHLGEGINKRTLFRDINYLIEEKQAPIHRPEKFDQTYYYTEKFSLKRIPIDEDEVATLRKAISVLRQVDNFSILAELHPIINKLENRIHIGVVEEKQVVQFEKHTSSSGQEHFDELFDAISNETVLRISYQPYAESTPQEKTVHPYLLKEFRNRWFLLGREDGRAVISNFALDRIRKTKVASQAFMPNDLFDPETYFGNLIGVSVPYNSKPETIELKVFKHSAPYIKTKPIHSNQLILKEYKDGSLLIELKLFINYELKSTLLGYGDGLVVLKPESLKEEINSLTNKMNSYY